TILNDSFLEDLGSTNGTLVNGQPIKKHFLQNSDVIEIGKYKLKYVNEATSSTTAADFEKTMVLRAPPKSVAPVEAKQTDTATNISTDGIKKALTDTQVNLHASGGLMATAPEPMAAKPEPMSITPPAPPTPAPAPGAVGGVQGVIQILSGPNAGKELPLTKALTTLGKPGVQVAVIAKRPQGYFITHVEGANFPVVNGKALDSQAHHLNDHDVIELAGVKMEFYFRAAA
ncbi:MAG: FHA domain-containing protein, partial [Betaproteobacteria bacterium]